MGPSMLRQDSSAASQSSSVSWGTRMVEVEGVPQGSFASQTCLGELPFLHTAGSPRVARPRISSKANNWASWIAWRARYVTSGSSAAGFGCVTLHVQGHQLAVEGSHLTGPIKCLVEALRSPFS